jgi:hypothetical protein
MMSARTRGTAIRLGLAANPTRSSRGSGSCCGLTVLKDRARELRPAYLPPDTAYEPGELAQCDFWFPPVTVPAGLADSVRAEGGAP